METRADQIKTTLLGLAGYVYDTCCEIAEETQDSKIQEQCSDVMLRIDQLKERLDPAKPELVTHLALNIVANIRDTYKNDPKDAVSYICEQYAADCEDLLTKYLLKDDRFLEDMNTYIHYLTDLSTLDK